MQFLALLVLCICAAVHGLRAMPVRARRGELRMSEPAKEGEWVCIVVRHACFRRYEQAQCLMLMFGIASRP